MESREGTGPSRRQAEEGSRSPGHSSVVTWALVGAPLEAIVRLRGEQDATRVPAAAAVRERRRLVPLRFWAVSSLAEGQSSVPASGNSG